ncbi:hypothetical protein ANCCAN_00843 [Ancylostoma caninum]|uniref:Uncharacterized protein n=1 Tax=Ancylostoma caninum TaxID=29170 RepID=A0A368HAX5_ANCCA|nr:hypothetical protein ANCCAN_00843 [Ancylostoma caninum]
MILPFFIFSVVNVAAFSSFQDCLYTADPKLLSVQEQVKIKIFLLHSFIPSKEILYGCSGQAYIGLLLCTADVLESNREELGGLLDESSKVSSVIECLRRE